MKKPKNKLKKASPRSAARLGAVQALFQLAMGDEKRSDLVVREYVEHRLGNEIDGEQFVSADDSLFGDVTKGAWERRGEWDEQITKLLNEDWSLERLDPVLHAILRAGAYELNTRPDIPTAVAINEYVEIAHAFFERREVSFINGLLDKIAKTCRQ